MYSLILDDTPSLASRHDSREALEEALARPLGKKESQEFDREHWGMNAEAIAAAETKDAMWGNLTYGETG